jgi:hypothetical protein
MLNLQGKTYTSSEDWQRDKQEEEAQQTLVVIVQGQDKCWFILIPYIYI